MSRIPDFDAQRPRSAAGFYGRLQRAVRFHYAFYCGFEFGHEFTQLFVGLLVDGDSSLRSAKEGWCSWRLTFPIRSARAPMAESLKFVPARLLRRIVGRHAVLARQEPAVSAGEVVRAHANCRAGAPGRGGFLDTPPQTCIAYARSCKVRR